MREKIKKLKIFTLCLYNVIVIMSVSNTEKEKILKLKSKYDKLSKRSSKALNEISISEIPEMVYNSNAIENSTLTLEETESIIFFDKIKKDHEAREIYEAKNLAKVIEALQSKENKKFSVELILNLHRILLS